MAKQTQSSSSFWRYLNISYYLKRPHLLAIVSFLFILATFVIWDHRTLVNEYEEEISRLYEENKELLKQLEERKSVFDGGKESNSKTLNNDHVNHEQDARFYMEDIDPITRERRNKVKEAMSHAWKSYVKYAWGYDELLPQSQRGANDLGGLGATIVDSLDTLYIMGFHDEFQKAKEWISNSLDFNKDYDASVFETTIRVLGGLLSAFDLSSEKIFLEKAKDLGERLLVAWNSPTGIPYGAINLASGRASNPGWTGGSSILADLGTEQIEFIALSQRTGELKYMQKVENVISQLKKVFPADGLLPIYISPGTGNPTNSKVTFGAMGDSFYEYLLKVWIQGNKTQTVQNYRDMWEQSMEGLMTLIKKSTPSSFVYIAERSGPNYLQDKMDELACFAPGMLALGSDGATPEKAEKYLNLAKELAWTCYNFYQRTPTKLAGENYYFRNGEDMVVGTSWNILRPETVESLMYLWRKTGDNVYREWGWDIFQAFEKQSRTESGYVGLRDVNSGAKDDKMQTFFLAETLKYLYLLFSPSSVIPLDEWVFNTEAHPIRIRTRNGEGLDLEGEIKIGETNNVKVLRNSLDSQSQRERHANINQVRDHLQKRNFRNRHIGKRDIGFNR